MFNCVYRSGSNDDVTYFNWAAAFQPSSNPWENPAVLLTYNAALGRYTWTSQSFLNGNQYICQHPGSTDTPWKFDLPSPTRAPTATTTKNCPPSYTYSPVFDRCLSVMYGARRTGTQAKTACNNEYYGGNVFSIRNAEENAYFLSHIQGFVDSAIWIGLQYNAAVMDWRWYVYSDVLNFKLCRAGRESENPTYYNWFNSGYYGPQGNFYEQSCTSFQTTAGTGYWRNEDCNVARYFFCERETVATPWSTNPSPTYAPTPTLRCSSNYAYNSGLNMCFRYSTGHITPWNNAKTICNNEGADLLNIKDAALNKFVYDEFQGFTTALWLGIYYDRTALRFK